MLSLSMISFALFRHRNLIPPIVSIPKIRNAVYVAGALCLIISIPIFPEIQNLLYNPYMYMKKRFRNRNQK